MIHREDEFVVFGMSSNRNVSFNYNNDTSVYSKAEWAEMTDREKDAVLMEYLCENVEVYVVEE